MEQTGGYKKIYEDLLEELKSINLSEAAGILNLTYNQAGFVEIPFLGRTYQLGPDGVFLREGPKAPTAHGSVLAGYVITSGRGEPAGKFVPMGKLTEMVPTRSGYVNNSLEARLARYADKDQIRFQQAVEKLNGREEGEAGSGGKSWIIDLLPKIPMQLIFYMGDDEFPAEAKLLFDITAVNFLEFEFLAVLTTIFVEEVIAQCR